MPTVGKVLIILIIVVSMLFMWMSLSVLEARNQWDTKVKKKADEAIKMAKEVEILANGSDEGRAEFEKMAKAVLELGSAAGRAEFEKRMSEGFDPKTAFEMAIAVFLDKKAIEDYQQAVAALNALENQPTLEQAQLDRANVAYKAAEDALKRTRDNLDTAYSMFLGQAGQQPGIRDPKVQKGMSVDALRDTVSRVQRAIGAQKTQFETMLSDGEKNFTELADRVKEVQNEATTMQKAAASEELERDERAKEVAQFEADLEKEKQDLVKETKLRDAEKDELAKLQNQFNEALAKCQQFVQIIKVAEIRIDATRGLKTAVVLETGQAPKGKVLQIAEDGTIQIGWDPKGVNVPTGVQLHVYRLDPQAEYLGIMELAKSDTSGAVGRMLPEFRQRSVRPGDEASTEITPESLKKSDR